MASVFLFREDQLYNTFPTWCENYFLLHILKSKYEHESVSYVNFPQDNRSPFTERTLRFIFLSRDIKVQMKSLLVLIHIGAQVVSLESECVVKSTQCNFRKFRNQIIPLQGACAAILGNLIFKFWIMYLRGICYYRSFTRSIIMLFVYSQNERKSCPMIILKYSGVFITRTTRGRRKSFELWRHSSCRGFQVLAKYTTS